MKYLYLFGYPLGHSVSPAMQNAALRAKQIRGVRYQPLPLPPERMDEMLAALRDPQCLGANVTVPHKRAILPYLDDLTDLARDIGAVNTLLKQNGRVVGDNTDIYGFLRVLELRGVTVKGKRAAILGAGGAAAAAAFALAQAGAEEIMLLNRTAARGEELAARLGAHFARTRFVVNAWERLARMALIVNATSVGMAPRVEASPLPPDCLLPRRAVVYDLVYNPSLTRLRREARARGARTIGGLEMLVYQGARAFELWTGARAPIRVMRAAARDELQAKRETIA